MARIAGVSENKANLFLAPRLFKAWQSLIKRQVAGANT